MDLREQTEYWSNSKEHKLLELFFSYKMFLKMNNPESQEHLNVLKNEIRILLKEIGGLGKLKQNLDELRKRGYGDIGNLPEFEPEQLAFLPEDLRK